MKYCKKCKIAGKETDTVCPKCKQPLSTFGSATPSAKPQAAQPAASPPPAATAASQKTAVPPRSPQTPPGVGTSPRPPQSSPGVGTPTAAPKVPTFTLTGQIAELEQIKQKNLKRGRYLGILSLLIALAILFLIYSVYSRTVLAYAVLENIKLEQDPVAESQITISFDVKTPGKVAFDRQSGTGHTEKVDLLTAAEPRETIWSWPSDPKTGIDFTVVSRGGWFLTTKHEHFKVTRKEVGVEVVFLMDVTSSMQPYINGLKEKCINFADEIRRDGIDCRLGLIGFGDVEINEPITVFEPNADPKEFQDAVARLELTQGGDPPESSVEAIEKALELEYRPHTRICFVHITDAGCHHHERIKDLIASLKENKVVTYVISQRNQSRLYSPLCVNGGQFYGIRDAPFESILQEVAKSISNQIKSD
jgi:hypothetical protein